MASSKYPPVAIVRQSFRYEDGRLFWLVRPRSHFRNDRTWKAMNSQFAGREAGFDVFLERQNCWQWRVTLFGRMILRHLIVWALHHGEWPTTDLDHKNRDSLDDRIENLRLATSSQNGANRVKQSNNTSGFKGVSWDWYNRRWRAQISVEKKRINLGNYDTPEEAHAAYCRAAKKYFGEFACVE
jgi:hypothetical protein